MTDAPPRVGNVAYATAATVAGAYDSSCVDAVEFCLPTVTCTAKPAPRPGDVTHTMRVWGVAT